jgi:membrane protein required for colicin V production
METYDLIMLGVLVVATVLGARKGLAWQVASLASIFASYYLAYRFRVPVAEQIRVESPWNTFAAMLLLYLGSALVIWLAFRFISGILDNMKLKDFDRHAGAVLGLGRGVLWCVIITLFAVTLLGESNRQAIVRSRSGHYIAQLLDRSEAIMPEEVHQVLAPYVRTLDERFGDVRPLSQTPAAGPAGFAPVPLDPYANTLAPPNPPPDPAAGGYAPQNAWQPAWPDPPLTQRR